MYENILALLENRLDSTLRCLRTRRKSLKSDSFDYRAVRVYIYICHVRVYIILCKPYRRACRNCGNVRKINTKNVNRPTPVSLPCTGTAGRVTFVASSPSASCRSGGKREIIPLRPYIKPKQFSRFDYTHTHTHTVH